MALLPVVAAPVGAEPGTTHAAWHVAAVELQLIMQLVVVELCASRSGLVLMAAADPTPIAPVNDSRTQIASTARTPSLPISNPGSTIARSRAAPKPASLRIARDPQRKTVLRSYQAVKM